MVLVPEDEETSYIEETLETIKFVGRARVRGRLFNAELKRLMVLVECREALTGLSVPPEVVPSKGGEAWPLILIDGSPTAAEDFQGKLKVLLQAEGRTMEDLKPLISTAQGSASPTQSILQAVGDFLEKTSEPTVEGGYRRLCIFYGTHPVAVGEEQFEQAVLIVEESECSEREKKRRIMESFKGPALQIGKAVRAINPEATQEEYLEALESAFGTAESGDDLYFAFRLMQQQLGEKLSDFRRRLERLLVNVVQRGGLPQSCKDRARVEQLLRGAVASDLMLIQLRLRERKYNLPTFLQLLSEIRSEEEYEASRLKLKTSVHPVQIAQLSAGK